VRAAAGVDSRRAALGRRRELRSARGRGRPGGEDIDPVGAAIDRAEDPFAERRRVDGAAGRWVGLDVVDAAARAEARDDRAPW